MYYHLERLEISIFQFVVTIRVLYQRYAGSVNLTIFFNCFSNQLIYFGTIAHKSCLKYRES
jgi:hypothetical protein